MAERSKPNSNGPQITWVNIVITIGLFTTMAGGAWALFQSQFNNLEQQLRSADSTTNALVKDLRGDLDRLRDNSVLRAEHIEFVKRLDEHLAMLQHRLDIIEQTRPTTGELENRASALRTEIAEIKDRIKFLEQIPHQPR